MNNCFHVVHDARPNFYVKLDLPSGKCYELSGCKRDSNSDAAVKAAATRSSVSAGGRCPSLPVAISCLLFFCSAETYPSWGWRGCSAREWTLLGRSGFARSASALPACLSSELSPGYGDLSGSYRDWGWGETSGKHCFFLFEMWHGLK